MFKTWQENEEAEGGIQEWAKHPGCEGLIYTLVRGVPPFTNFAVLQILPKPC